ncbi:MAG: toprim domain-containing protein, partial [Bryobacteraceae bacterium]
GRLMFPIHNESGKIIAFAGRALREGDEPKYLNSPETALYHKTYVLYNLHRAKDAVRKLDRAILVEGYMDVIGVYSAGIREVVASCGTALTNTQVRSLKRHSETVVVNFDPDAAGTNAAERSIQMLLDESMRVRVLELDGGLDPDEFVAEHGADGYHACVEKAPGYFQWLAGRARKRFDTRTSEGRMDALNFLMPAVQRISDKLERAAVAGEVAVLLGVEQGLVLEQFRKIAVDRRGAVPARPPSAVPVIERILIHSILASSETRGEILPRLRDLPAVARFQTRLIFEILLGLEEAGEPITFAHLEARLPEKECGLLHEVISADEISEEVIGLEPALACLRELELMDGEKRTADLKTRIKDAARNGNMEDALRWTGELDRLKRAGPA